MIFFLFFKYVAGSLRCVTSSTGLWIRSIFFIHYKFNPDCELDPIFFLYIIKR